MRGLLLRAKLGQPLGREHAGRCHVLVHTTPMRDRPMKHTRQITGAAMHHAMISKSARKALDPCGAGGMLMRSHIHLVRPGREQSAASHLPKPTGPVVLQPAVCGCCLHRLQSPQLAVSLVGWWH